MRKWAIFIGFAVKLTFFTASAVFGQTAPLSPTGAISQYGCFAQSGDGGDLLPNGTVAPLVPAGSIPWNAPAPCGLQWISSSASATAPAGPSTVTFTRTFDLAPALVAGGQFTLSFKVDDAAQFFLNGSPVAAASCTPPVGNDGECQAYCHVFNIPASAFLAGTNVLQVKMINLFNVSVGTGFGWTSLSYSLCVSPASGAGSPTPGATLGPTASMTPTPVVIVTATPTFTATPTPTPTVDRASLTPTPERTCDPEPYPNPCRDRVHFHLGGGPYDEVHLKVYSVGYREMCHRQWPVTGQHAEDLEWDLKDDHGHLAANGLYYVGIETRCRHEIHRYTKKLLILR